MKQIEIKPKFIKCYKDILIFYKNTVVDFTFLSICIFQLTRTWRLSDEYSCIQSASSSWLNPTSGLRWWLTINPSLSACLPTYLIWSLLLSFFSGFLWSFIGYRTQSPRFSNHSQSHAPGSELQIPNFFDFFTAQPTPGTLGICSLLVSQIFFPGLTLIKPKTTRTRNLYSIANYNLVWKSLKVSNSPNSYITRSWDSRFGQSHRKVCDTWKIFKNNNISLS